MSRATPTQRAVIESRGRELAVAAGAGSGKTSTLIKRIIGLITGSCGDEAPDAGRALELTRLLVVTFTRAAASELRERVDGALADAISEQEQALRLSSPIEHARIREMLRHLRRQRTLLPLAHISTIHSFCQRVINQYGAVQGLSAGRLLTEEDAAQLKHQLATRFLDRQLGRVEDGELRELAFAWGGRDGVGPAKIAQDAPDTGLRTLLLKLASFQQGLLDPQAWWVEQQAVPELDPARFDPEHPLVAGLLRELTQWRDETIAFNDREAAALALEQPDAVHLQYSAHRQYLLRQLDTGGSWAAPSSTFNALLAKCDGLAGRPKLPYSQTACSAYRRDIDKSSPWYGRLGESSEQFKSELLDWARLFSEPWPAVALRENTVRMWLARLWRLGLEFDAEYRAVKQQRQAQDFNDLERGALKLLAAETGVYGPGSLRPSQVALELRGAFREVLVDEYQDVNRLQDAILRLVTPDLPGAEGQARVVVGDIKQSIYGFRQAEPEIFRALVSQLETKDQEGLPARSFRLRENFRSRAGILSAINTLMNGLFTSELGGEDYSAGGALEYGGEYGIEPVQAGGELARLHLVLDTSNQTEAYAEDGAGAALQEQGLDAASTETGTDEKAYHHLARRLREVYLAGQATAGYLTGRGTGKRRPVQWEDLVVLLRSRTGLGLLRIILEQAGIPAQVPASGSYFDQPDVQDALLLLRAVASPYDDLALAACLRGPLGRFSNTDLLIALHGAAEPMARHAPVVDKLAAFLTAPAAELPYAPDYLERVQTRIQAMLSMLAVWRSAAAREPVATVVWRVLIDAGLLVSAAAAPYGAQRCANLYELHDRALEFDAGGRFGLARFLEYLAGVEASAQDAGEFPAAAGAGAVRILTVHQAKGLEFPCVFLPYMHRRFNERDLRQQVLMSYSGGLAGQHLDFLGPLAALRRGELPELPQRKSTLKYRQVQRLLQRQLAAEELRLLYVALTRAQERLELITVLKLADLAAIRTAQQPPRPEQARRPWDWLRRQLGDGIRAAVQHGMGTEVDGTGGWTVSTAQAPASEDLGEAERRSWERVASAPAGPHQLSGLEQQQLRERLAYRYPWPGSMQLPVKVTITGLAKHAEPSAVRPAEGRFALTTEGLAGQMLPGFISQGAAETPLRHGSAVHRLLALLEVTTAKTENEITALWERAGEPELGRRYAAKASRMIQDLAVAFGPWGGVAQARELPVTMAVVPAELPGLLDLQQIELKQCHPDDWVLVQGVLDLLLRWADRAVVLDYKTDRGLNALALKKRYQAQLQWYARAVRELWPDLPGQAITCALYAFNGPGLVIL